MDFPRFSPPDWPMLLTQAPDAIAAALISAVATLALIVGFAPRLPLGRTAATGPADASNDCEFLINGSSVKPLSEAARALLDGLGATEARLAALAAHLAPDCPEIHKDLEALVLYGTPFRHHCPRHDGTAIELMGQPRAGAAWFAIRPASEDARALKDAQAALGRARSDAGFLRSVLDHAPVLAWSTAPDGQVGWANAAYRERFDAPGPDALDHRIPNAFGHVLEEVPLTPRGGGSRRRVSIPGRQNAEAHWFEVSQTQGPDGETLGFALAADDLVAAEASLRRFVETLTETFAHLPIGLAVFDKNRRLGLFNPALTDLVKIDAVWLAGRPSLRDFLERLRETRQMPEQKDFSSWRRKLGELEEGARDGTYEENWVLPSGKIFRVTGRPHPQGALAFLFEDISTSIILERKYRSELELSQATLDRMVEAVAVFDTSGMLVFVNSAFEALWGLDPMARLEGPGVSEMTRLCAERCAPSPIWAQLAEFATAADSRTSWTAAVETLDGRVLHLLVAPLPDASSLVVFRDLSAERADLASARDRLAALGAARLADAAIETLALEELHQPVEQAVRQLMAAIPSAATPEAFQALSGAAQALKDGLARSRELQALAHPAESAAEPLSGLARALAARGLALAPCREAAAWDPEMRRFGLALGLAAADLAAPGTEIALGGDETDGRRLTAEATVPAEAASRAEAGPGLGLLRRLAEAAGAGLEIAPSGDRVTLRVTLATGQTAPAPNRALRA
ncbi:MAG: PAS-domain containing protein [Amaricoccus sp.]